MGNNSYGKNAPAHLDHVRTVRYPNGNQGFSSNKLGSDTKPGTEKGAPLVNSKQVEKDVKHHVLNDNPYNLFDRDNTRGVVFEGTDFQPGAPNRDSPVPAGATRPMKDQAGAARSIASAPTGDTFPADGVLGHT